MSKGAFKLLSATALSFHADIQYPHNPRLKEWMEERQVSHRAPRKLKLKKKLKERERKMISSKNDQPDFINPDCTCRISKGLQTSVFLM